MSYLFCRQTRSSATSIPTLCRMPCVFRKSLMMTYASHMPEKPFPHPPLPSVSPILRFVDRFNSDQGTGLHIVFRNTRKRFFPTRLGPTIRLREMINIVRPFCASSSLYPHPLHSSSRELGRLQTILVQATSVSQMAPFPLRSLTLLRLNKVSVVDTSTKLLGIDSSLPIYIAPAALARLGHNGGEVNMVHVAGQEGILQGVSNLGSRGTLWHNNHTHRTLDLQ
jgi:hypothetical protein